MISKLTSIVQSRKGLLINFLSANKDMSLEKQHQIYGAIVELDTISEMLDKHRTIDTDRTDRTSNIKEFLTDLF